MTKETLSFQTEVKQLLHLMIHSLYSNRDIFLRELISNASDACDKLRVEALSNDALFEGQPDLRIRVGFDAKERTITISDNGVGMSREEIIANLGTIARSGTKEFFNRLSGDSAKDNALIGQFGVGFYSAFIVAEHVTVISRRAGLPASDAVRWESEGTGDFSIEGVERVERGTDIILRLRKPEGEADDQKSHDDLLSHWKLKEILKRYSDHIGIPIQMKKREWDEKKSEYVEADEWETVNQASALWTRSKGDISDEQYKEFYKGLAHGMDEPLAYTHNRVEGRTEYTQLLFIPGKAPFDLYDRNQRHGLKLYIKRVFIMEDAEQLLPNYLRFVRGVVDSADLPLNVSREILQESRDVKAIREGCTKRVLGLLEDVAENRPDDYKTFWREFGQCLKEGFGEDFSNKDRLAALARFVSTSSEGDEPTTSLKDYVGRMKDGQEKIYVITADSLAAARSSPHLEVFRKKGIEVLLLTDRIDEWMLSFLTEFDGKTLQSVAKGSLDLGKLADKEDKAPKETEKKAKPAIEKAQKILGDKVKEVRLTQRLTDSACCLVSDEQDVSGHLERILKAAGQKAPDRKPILELNPDHPLVQALIAESDAAGGQIVGADGQQVSDGISQTLSDLVWLLHDQALLAEGGQPDDPASFVKRLNGFLLKGLGR
ncbi:MAG: molecular chaperone HtpG [Betaproteobacteria bacterium]|nr:molecular chaperone HtpG [Betaproteobacteria bacterium]NBT74392.1 molecular chaperone HtpG [Betaproteobacteria bacterium]NBY14389.1 molecular chaperone HtpG [Betaproteobacteria bacterium]NCA16369.1 molecular chaperone HtpG [Betaproteobacteria bacterium]